MGKLIYGMNVSADGYIETPDGDINWPTIDEEIHGWFNDRMRGLQASLYGRRLYEVMNAYWPTAEGKGTEVENEFARIWNRTPKIVFSSSLESVDGNARLVNGDVATVLAEVRREFDGDLEVGGANLAGQFVREGLVDEYDLIVHPVTLGAGKPFWPQLDAPVPLRLIRTRTFESGVVALTYERAQA
jgi:dihydrofolate reductase